MLYESREEKEKAGQKKNIESCPQNKDETISDEMFENQNEKGDKDDPHKEITPLNDKDVLVACSFEEYESDFQIFKSVEEAEHYIVNTQNIENDLYIINNDNDDIQNYDINIINRLFKSYKFISVMNAIESGLIREKESSLDENKVAEHDEISTNNEELDEHKSYYNDFDSTSLFLNEE